MRADTRDQVEKADYTGMILNSLAARLRAAGLGGVLRIDTCDVLNTFSEKALCDDTLKAIDHIRTWLPAGAMPVMFAVEKDGTGRTTLSGIPIDGLGDEAVGTTIRDLAFIRDLFEDHPGTCDDSYAFGRAGRMNPGDRIATIWAASPAEAALKFAATMRPGLSAAPVDRLFSFDPHQAGRMQMRRCDTWTEYEVQSELFTACARVEGRFEGPEPM
ncbi:hypothetical protein [Defluviimonas salinarum]|uniref:Uncharacterized protein n=1 Tax=Defluviimonas salinarum TaxID=2992147 RepID=A0ABT3J873_9RHOB|nr:hypothetical protein [Defluviimonas salinarum]MCW3783883.1 hypothetical protein [Defluviimonas salinarum]